MRYKTIARESFWETVTERSRFLANSFLAEDEESVAQKLSAVRKAFPGATHYCYAYSLGPGSNISRHSDDGEPSKTAGMPILEAIKRRGLYNTLVVVTRYFGGVKLGTGGLVRAYGEAASKVLEISGETEYIFSSVYSIELDYAYAAAIEKAASDFGTVLERDYAQAVKFRVACPAERAGGLEKAVSEASAGRASLIKEGEKFLPYPPKQ